jgi:precorrin-6B methylase 2
MLTNLVGKKFTGDLSLQDADILVEYAKKSKHILEYGGGGSTQIMSQCGAQSITSVDTSPEWIELTRRRINQINQHTPVIFLPYTSKFEQMYDMIFVDGEWQLREEFATDTWKNLRVGGVMLFHDTRRDFDFANVMVIAKKFYLEITQIEINAPASDGKSSNITVLHKKVSDPYENWNKTENKPAWAYGSVPGTEDMPLWEYK